MNQHDKDILLLGFYIGAFISWGLTFFLFVLPLRNKK